MEIALQEQMELTLVSSRKYAVMSLKQKVRVRGW